MIDPFSNTWRHVADWASAELRRGTDEIESPGLDLASTEYHRGRIAVLRGLLAMAKPRLEMTDTPITY